MSSEKTPAVRWWPTPGPLRVRPTTTAVEVHVTGGLEPPIEISLAEQIAWGIR